MPREIYPFKERITWLKSPFFSWQAIWALKCVRQRLNESLKISKFTRICMKYHSSVAGWQEFSRGRCNRFFWDIRLKIYRLLNFNMLFHFLRTEFSKSKLFSCSQKFDHDTNYCKRPIRFFKRRFRLLSPWNFATMATWRNDYPVPFPLHDSRFISTAFVCWLVSEPCRLESKEIDLKTASIYFGKTSRDKWVIHVRTASFIGFGEREAREWWDTNVEHACRVMGRNNKIRICTDRLLTFITLKVI